MNRTLLLLSLLATFLVFSACKKDEDPTPETISGTYTLTSIVPSEGLDPEVDGVFGDMELMDNINCSSKLILDDADGAIYQYARISQSIIPVTVGTIDYTPMTCFGDTGDYSYTLIDGSLTISGGGGTTIFTVNSATELEFSMTDRFPVDENGVVKEKQISLTYTYTK